MGIQQICDAIRNLFNAMRAPMSTLPLLIMVCSLIKRPGLSVIISAGNIIRSQSSFGAPTSATLPDGQPNMMNSLIVQIVDEIYRAIREDMSLQVVIPSGSISVTTTGSNAGGPVVSTGYNVAPASGRGAAL